VPQRVPPQPAPVGTCRPFPAFAQQNVYGVPTGMQKVPTNFSAGTFSLVVFRFASPLVVFACPSDVFGGLALATGAILVGLHLSLSVVSALLHQPSADDESACHENEN
jgi:hypothetical protein